MEGADMRIGGVFDRVPPDSSTTVVAEAARMYRDEGCDAIIAVGGGSVIDTAKGINIVVSEGSEDLSGFAGADVLQHPLKPFAVVPTTAGTGSETTLVAVIADAETGRKILLTSSFLLPDLAFVDPRMTVTLPPGITAATAMDALTHALEAYTCLGKNPLSDAYAGTAMGKIGGNLIGVLEKPRDIEKRLALALASTLAGIAFSNSMVGLVHTLGHSVGSCCHVPHGTVMSILLPEVLRYNLAKAGPGYAEILGEALFHLAGPEVYSRTPAEDRPRGLLDALEDLRKELEERAGLPRTLAATGKVSEADLPRIVEVSMGDASGTYNPAEYSRENLLAILRKVYD
jgi:alcohol dehydrogenase